MILDTSKLKHTFTPFQLSGASKFRLASKWLLKVGSRHGSVIPVLAENPNHPEEQSAVVMCGQSLKTAQSHPVLP